MQLSKNAGGLTDVSQYKYQEAPREDNSHKEWSSQRAEPQDLRNTSHFKNKENTETMWRTLEARLVLVEARAQHGSCRRTETSACTAEAPKFDGSASWAMFQQQFKAMVRYNYWIPSEKVTFLIATLNEPAAHTLHVITTVAINRKRLCTHSWRKRTQLVGKFLQELSAAIDYLAHHAHFELPKYLISKETSHAFADGIKERDIRQQLFLGGSKIGPRTRSSWNTPFPPRSGI
jgi:hypothetical protein